MVRRYGPHRPEDAPQVGRVRDVAWKRSTVVEVPLHPALVKQRRRVNDIAWREGSTRRDDES